MPRRSLSQYKDLSEHPALSRTAEIAYAQKAAAPKTAVHQARRSAALTPPHQRTAQTPAPSLLDPTNWYPGTVGSFALNGNHEMYALGNGYFDVFLPTLGVHDGPESALSKPGVEGRHHRRVDRELSRQVSLRLPMKPGAVRRLPSLTRGV